MNRASVWIPITCFLWLWILGSQPRAQAKEIPFDSGAWKISAGQYRIESHRGKQALFLKDGKAILPDVAFEDGVIELDILTQGERGFSGVIWRWENARNYETFYLRPHLSDQVDATQYQPVFHGVDAWQIYGGVDCTAKAGFKVGQWMHLRIEILGDRAQVFLDSPVPILVIDDLKRDSRSGGLGISSGFAPAYFANFRFEQTSDLEMAPAKKSKARLSGAGVVREWIVSDAFMESELRGRLQLDAERANRLNWRKLQVETNGIANLARIQGLDHGNTVLARLLIDAEEATRQRIDFGFSDRVHVFLNGDLIFSADDSYRTRDYRFLGSVGLFDSLYCDLQSGKNVLDFAVSEDFGGWAVAARLGANEGVTLISD